MCLFLKVGQPVDQVAISALIKCGEGRWGHGMGGPVCFAKGFQYLCQPESEHTVGSWGPMDIF